MLAADMTTVTRPHPRKTRPTPGVDTTGWITRTQAIDMMGISYNTIILWERRGLVHPARGIHKSTKTARSVVMYDPDELAKMPQYRRVAEAPKQIDPGERTARAFELFDQGKGVREAVIELRETVGRVEELRLQWLDLGGLKVGHVAIVGRLRTELEALLGPFDSGDDLLAHVQTLVQRAKNGETEGQ